MPAGQLPAVKALDPLGGEAQGGDGLGRRQIRAGGDLGGREAQIVGAEPDPVEPVGVLDERRIAARGDIVDDRRDGIVDIGRALALRREERAERRLEAGIAGAEGEGHNRSTGIRLAPVRKTGGTRSMTASISAST